MVKNVLVMTSVLRLVHGIVRLAEGLRLPDSLLARVYSGVVGVHIFRGFRRALPAAEQ